jgi:hypothetical protein
MEHETEDLEYWDSDWIVYRMTSIQSDQLISHNTFMKGGCAYILNHPWRMQLLLFRSPPWAADHGSYPLSSTYTDEPIYKLKRMVKFCALLTNVLANRCVTTLKSRKIFVSSRKNIKITQNEWANSQRHLVKQWKLYLANHMDQLRLSEDSSTPLSSQTLQISLGSQER